MLFCLFSIHLSFRHFLVESFRKEWARFLSASFRRHNLQVFEGSMFQWSVVQSTKLHKYYSLSLVRNTEVKLCIIVNKNLLVDSAILVYLSGDSAYEFWLYIFWILSSRKCMWMILSVVVGGEKLDGDWILVISVEHLKCLIYNCSHSFWEGVLDILQKVNVKDGVLI